MSTVLTAAVVQLLMIRELIGVVAMSRQSARRASPCRRHDKAPVPASETAATSPRNRLSSQPNAPPASASAPSRAWGVGVWTCGQLLVH